MSVKLKICGMKLQDNILGVAALQPDYMGFIFYRKSKRHVDGLAPEQLGDISPAIVKTGVFVNEAVGEVARLVGLYGLGAVQLHGSENPAYLAELRALLPEGTELIKAFGIGEAFDFSALDPYDAADYFLFDTQTPDHGGSGKTFDWELLSGYHLTKPYFLSGGIGLESLEALNRIRDERLYAIDVNSRFELEPGLKNIEQLNDFKHKLAL